MKTLDKLLLSELDKRGWSIRRLADESGVPQPTLSRIINMPDRVPDLVTLGRISKALDISLKRLVESCGFIVDETADVSGDLASMAAAVPELWDIFEPVAALEPENRAAVLALVRAFVSELEVKKRRSVP